MKKEQKIICCWGDSITQGLGASDDEHTYPAVLQQLIGDEYVVYNGGDGGEGSAAIMARQGAVQAVLKRDAVFLAGETETCLGNADDTGICLPDGRNVKLTAQMGNQMKVNPTMVGEGIYRVELKDYRWNTATTPITYACMLVREAPGQKLTIPAGTSVTFSSAADAGDAYCTIFFMGANDVGKSSIELAEQGQQLLHNVKNGQYLCMIPYWGNRQSWTPEDDAVYTAAFGRHAVNFREAVITDGLAAEGLTPTDEDRQRMAQGLIPSCLCMNNRPDVHLNNHGYHLMATLLYKRGCELGYWR